MNAIVTMKKLFNQRLGVDVHHQSTPNKRKAEDKTGETPEEKIHIPSSSPVSNNMQTDDQINDNEYSSDSDSNSNDESSGTITGDDSCTSGTTSSSLDSNISINVSENDSVAEVLRKILKRLRGLGKSYQELVKSNKFNSDILEANEEEIKTLKCRVKSQDEKITALEIENLKLRKNHEKLEAKLVNIDLETKKCSVQFSGIRDNNFSDHQWLEKTMISCLNHIEAFCGQASSIPIKSIARLGKFNPNKQRTVLMEFHNYTDVLLILEHKHQLPNGVYAREYLPEIMEERRQEMLKIYLHAKKLPEYQRKCRMEMDTLILKGKTYTVGNVHELPSNLAPSKICERRDTNHVAFFGGGTPLSNFYPCPITYEGFKYCSVEQILQSEKAELYNEDTIQAKILLTNNPTEAKRLAKNIAVIEQQWIRESTEIAKKACLLKFQQNPELQQYLLDTEDLTLVEASPDPFWGTGVHLKNEHVLDPDLTLAHNSLLMGY